MCLWSSYKAELQDYKTDTYITECALTHLHLECLPWAGRAFHLPCEVIAADATSIWGANNLFPFSRTPLSLSLCVLSLTVNVHNMGKKNLRGPQELAHRRASGTGEQPDFNPCSKQQEALPASLQHLVFRGSLQQRSELPNTKAENDRK